MKYCFFVWQFTHCTNKTIDQTDYSRNIPNIVQQNSYDSLPPLLQMAQSLMPFSSQTCHVSMIGRLT